MDEADSTMEEKFPTFAHLLDGSRSDLTVIAQIAHMGIEAALAQRKHG